MFELHDVSLLIAAKPQELVLLGDVTAAFPSGTVTAVVGPPKSGKSTLLKLLAGVCQPTFGEVVWTEDRENPNITPTIAYLPQLPLQASFESGLLTVAEHLGTALSLRVAGLRKAARKERVEALLEKTGLTAVAGQRLNTVGADQQRRLALAVELTGSPALLLCDEVNGAFDPKTDLEFTKLLHNLAREESCAIVHITHALGNMEMYDSVMVLQGSQLAFHGPPEFLAHYFQIETPVDLFEQLAIRRPDDWHRSWVKHGNAYRSTEGQEQMADEISDEDRRLFLEKLQETKSREPKQTTRPPSRLPNAFSQFLTLLVRRWRQGLRNFPAIGRQLALLIGLPCAVVVFAAGDLTRLQELSEQLRGNVVDLLKENPVFAVDATRGAGLIAGLAMAQGLLLAFMATNNAAREISGERMAFEREKYSGLRVGAYVASKVAYLLPVVLLQAAWMGWYVHAVCRFPGDLVAQIGVLALVNGALTMLCLAISSLTRAAWRALLICFSFAALQLPFSGTVLSPPEALSWVFRPLVTLYWGASAYLHTMQNTRFYEVLQVVSPLTLSPELLCIIVLAAQIAMGFITAVFGCKIARLGITWRHTGI